jgi:hypothetical protein
MSAASDDADSYRRARSFSMHFITIQSSSPRIAEFNWRGSTPRCAATCDSVASVDRRVLGFSGSISRMIRCISPYALERRSRPSSGVSPVNNS